VILRRRRRRVGDTIAGHALALPLVVQLLEADYLDDRGISVSPDRPTSRIVQGIELDQLDTLRAYWLLSHHPGDYIDPAAGRFDVQPSRISARDVAHLYRPLRPGQLRGVPVLSPVLQDLRQLDDYMLAERERKRLEACVMAWVTKQGAASPADDLPVEAFDPESELKPVTDGDGYMLERLEPGTVAYLNDGQEVKFNQPTSTPMLSEYIASALREVASGTGLTYEQISGDLSRVNYSSYRAGQLEFRAHARRIAIGTIVPRLCMPLWRWFVESAVFMGELPPQAASWRVRWTAPTFEPIDLKKEVEGYAEATRAGFMSWGAVAELFTGMPADLAADRVAESLDVLESKGLEGLTTYPGGGKGPASQDAPAPAGDDESGDESDDESNDDDT